MPAQLAHWLILIAGSTAAAIVAPAPTERWPEPVGMQTAPIGADDKSTFTPPTADEIHDLDARVRVFIA